MLRAMVTTAAQQARQILDAPKRAAQQARIAKAALILRQLAIAAAALATVPDAGSLADSVHRALDAAVNRGGRIRLKGGKLYRTTPPPPATVGADFLPQVAPAAMRKVENAVYAARLALGRFGENLGPNLATTAHYAAAKAATTQPQTPAAKAALALAQKALGNARTLLGPLAPDAAPATRPAQNPGTSNAVVWNKPGKRPARAPAGAQPKPASALAVRPSPPPVAAGYGKILIVAAGIAAGAHLLRRK